jgi:hypothetical protein
VAARCLRHQTITFEGDNTEELLELLARVTGPVQYKTICRYVRRKGADELLFDETGDVFISRRGRCVAEARRSHHRHPRALLVLMTVLLNLILNAATGGAAGIALVLGGASIVLFEAWPRRVTRGRKPVSHRLMAAVPWMGLDVIWDHDHDDWWL